MSNKETNPPDQINGDAKAADEEVITQLTLAGLKVIMLRKGDQIIYKLPDNMNVASISTEQREQLMAEIQKLHAATMAAAARNTNNAEHAAAAAAAAASAKTIAPKHNGIAAPLPLAALSADGRQSAAEADALKETARKLREEYEQEQRMNEQNSGRTEVKTTRKYVKTGKYSKKRLQQQQPQQTPQPLGTQVQQPAVAQIPSSSQPQPPILNPQQLLALQQLSQAAAATPNGNAAGAANKAPIPLPSAFASKSILAKRLPEEEAHHQEVKRRIFESMMSDREAVINPDYETPFKSKEDVIKRLLPYHIYQYPKADLDINKIPMDRQDHATMDIFKSQADMFEKFSKVSSKMTEGGGTKQLQILLERQLLADQRQRLTEEQARVAAEQAALQHQEMLRIQAEQARLAAAAAAAAAVADSQRTGSSSPATANYANGLAQATAILQNPQFQSQYNQLPPEMQQILRNREQLAALIEQHSKDPKLFAAPPSSSSK